MLVNRGDGLSTMGVTSVMLEGGTRVISSALDATQEMPGMDASSLYFDVLLITCSPQWIGGESVAVPSYSASETSGECGRRAGPRVQAVRTWTLDDDVVVLALPPRPRIHVDVGG